MQCADIIQPSVQLLLVFPVLCTTLVAPDVHHYDALSSSRSHSRHKREVTLGNRTSCSPASDWPLVRVNTTDRLRQLRTLMRNIQAYIIPTEDEHQSENVAEHDKRRTFISGFSGSEGTAIVTADTAAVWTDGRYFLQAEEELDCNWVLMKSGLPGVPTMMEWLKTELRSGDTAGADPRLIGSDTWIVWKEELDKAGIQLVVVEQNLVDEIWTEDRPPLSTKPIFILDLKYAGKSWEEKVRELRVELQERGAEAMVITAMDEVAWLFNLRGSDLPSSPVFRSYAVVSSEEVLLFIPSYKMTTEIETHLKTDQCGRTNSTCVRVHEYESLLDVLPRLQQGRGKVLLPARYSYSGGASYAIYNKVPEARRLVQPSPVLLHKSQKNPTEVKGMQSAHVRDAVAVCDFMATLEEEVRAGKGDWDEMRAADVLKGYRRQQADNRGDSFETISAFGSNGAIIHYTAQPSTNKKLDTSTMYLLDSGGQYLDGTTDVTRTFHFGTPTDFQRETYTRVLMGQIDLALLVFPEGTTDMAVDVVARAPLFAIGLNYRHGTGHGIGAFLYVHEGPIQVRIYSKEQHKFAANQFLSDEPGYYEDGKFGIRLENIVRVVEKPTPHQFDGSYLGFEPVTLIPYEPKLIKKELLSNRQLEWLNNYNAMVRMKVGEEMKKQGRMKGFRWLMSKSGYLSETSASSAISQKISTTSVLSAAGLVCLQKYMHFNA